jgi:LCP family protein required for cell wall assembly
LKIRTIADQRHLIAWLSASFVLSLLLTGVVAAKTYVDQFGIGTPGGIGSIFRPQPATPPWEVFGSDKLTFILLGYDSVDEFAHRSDTLMVGAVDFYARSVRILSVPRDTLARIPDHGFDKINAAYALGHEDLVRRTVQDFVGVDVDYVVSVDYEGFVKVIDAFGGVDITVERAMHYDDRRGNVHIHFDPGRYHMDGRQALDYARFRHDATGDFGRIQRQQGLMKAVFEQAIKPGNMVRIRAAAEAFLQSISVTVNDQSPRHPPPIGLNQILSMIGFISQLDSDQIRFYQVPSEEIRWHGLSCLRPDYRRTMSVLEEVFTNYAEPGWELESQNQADSTASGEDIHPGNDPV